MAQLAARSVMAALAKRVTNVSAVSTRGLAAEPNPDDYGHYPDPLEHATGREKKMLIARLAGDDRYEPKVYYRAEQTTKEKPNLIPLESIERLPQFEDFVSRLHAVGRAPYIIFFDSNQLEVTKNHICNLRPLPGAVERLAAVAFDEASEAALKSFDPTIPIITVDFSLVRKTLPADLENKKYITYQLILMLRARVVTALAKRGLNFWAMQQDTIWTANFPAMNIEDQKREANLLFDTVGNDQFRIYEKMKNWICGSTVISNSNFFMGNRRPVPFLIQVDHDSPLPKMELLRKWNLEFKYANGTCNPDAMKTVKYRKDCKAIHEV
ncbi:unnamed protein product, partial [Mesorhabditis spiculigera]